MLLALISSLNSTVSLALVGDVMLGRFVGQRMVREGLDAPLKGAIGELKRADLALANLECPLTNRPFSKQKSILLSAKPESVGAIRSAFQAVNVANNHSYDCGQAGFEETCSTLTNAKIGVIGRSGIPWITTIKGLRIGVLGFSEFEDPGLGRFSDAPLAIQKLRQHVDLLIVSVHWGIEMHSEPTDDQRKRAKEWIKSGADIVVGHHPHVWQPLELVDGKLVCYSLGDFLFDSPYGERRSTGILRVIWSKSKGATFEKVPVKIQNGFPVLAK